MIKIKFREWSVFVIDKHRQPSISIKKTHFRQSIELPVTSPDCIKHLSRWLNKKTAIVLFAEMLDNKWNWTSWNISDILPKTVGRTHTCS